MNVGFFLVDTGTVDASMGFQCGAALVQSVRQSMPGVPVVQFTDDDTAEVDGVDDVRRLPVEPLARLRMHHQASVEGDWLFVDSDVWIQRDVRDVFASAFDIAITTRNWPHLKVATGFTKRMPFNVGVVFSRSRGFWKDVYKRLGSWPYEDQQWMGDQKVICDIVSKPSRYRYAFLNGLRYNLPPAMEPTAETQRLERKAAIIHYKGTARKALLLDRIRGCA